MCGAVRLPGMDRLCCCTGQGQLHFYAVGPRMLQRRSSETELQASPVRVGGSGGGLGTKDEAAEANGFDTTHGTMAHAPVSQSALGILLFLFF